MSKVLYIGLDYYHYPNVISEAIKLQGDEVDFYPIEPRTLFFKITRYVAQFCYRNALDRYHKSIISKTKNIQYDKVFFITTHFFSEHNLNLLKNIQANAKFIAYHWDSISQYNYLETIKYFDETYSFDREDCQNHDLQYLPLFASGIYRFQQSKNYNNEVYTVGSIVKPARYLLVRDFRKICQDHDISYQFHLKVTPITYFRLLLHGVFPKGVSFRTLELGEMEKLVDNSLASLDVTNHEQSGLTMRMIENIYAGRKVITTNANIQKEKFYDKKQVFIWTGTNADKLKNFLKLDYTPKKINELSVNSWVQELLK